MLDCLLMTNSIILRKNKKMEDEMPKGYIIVSYLELPTEENLSNYAPKAMEAIKNAGGKFIARGMPVATYENGMNQRQLSLSLKVQMQPEPPSPAMCIRPHLHY